MGGGKSLSDPTAGMMVVFFFPAAKLHCLRRPRDISGWFVGVASMGAAVAHRP
jgi:hypothetical protein